MTSSHNHAVSDSELARIFACLPSRRLAIAVSGGRDSIVLMHLLSRWIKTASGANWLREVNSLDSKLPLPNRGHPDRSVPLRRPKLAARAGWLGEQPDRAALHSRLAASGIVVLTVDHRLRAASAEEAAFVAKAANALGFPHHTLVWEHATPTSARPTSGLQARAREARYDLMSDAIEDEWWLNFAVAGVRVPRRVIVTAHHRSDQIETFLMRLKRGSGLDGLAGMSPLAHRNRAPTPERPYPVDVEICRPLLDLAPERLAATARTLGLDWREDPSNADRKFERVRMREEMTKLEALGFNSDRLHRSVRRLQGAHQVVRHLEHRQLYGGPDDPIRVELNGGLYASIEFDRAALSRGGGKTVSAHSEMLCRLLSRTINLYGGGSPVPRLSEIEDLVEAMLRAMVSASRSGNGLGQEPRAAEANATVSTGRTLGGCRIDYVHHRDPSRCRLRVWRERGRRGFDELPLAPGACGWWDGRFSVAASPDASAAVTVRGLGAERWAQLRRRVPALNGLRGVPPGAVATLPAFWIGEDLASVPFFEHLPASVPWSLRLEIEREWRVTSGLECQTYTAHFQPGAQP